MTQRREWTFQKTGEELEAAAKKRAEYHLKRLAFWEEARDKAEQQIKDSGFEVRRHTVTGGERAEVTIDPGLVARLAECERKMEQHRERANEYAQWVAALKTVHGTQALDFDDWLYFYGLRGDEDE